MHYWLHLGKAHTSMTLRSVCTIGHIFVFYLIFFEKGAGPLLLLNLLSYERPAGFPPLMFGQLGVCGAPPCPIAAPLARKRGSRYIVSSIIYS